MKKVIIIFIFLITLGISSTRVYDVEPYKNFNGVSREIGQTFVANCDSFVWVEIFIGKPNDIGII